MAERKSRVLFVCSHPTQYSAPLFRAMAQDVRLDILVAYCSLQGAEPGLDPEFGIEVAWDIPLLEGYPWIEIANRSPRPGIGHFFGLVNPGLYGLVRHGGFDAVVSFIGYVYASFWILLAAAKASGVALLFGTDAVGLQPRDGKQWKACAKKLLLPAIFRLATIVIAPSEASRQFIGSLGVPGPRIVLTPFVVDNDWWLQRAAEVNRGDVRRLWRIPDDSTVVLYCAKLQPWKRPVDLLRAFARAGLDSAHLVFAGDGPLRASLEAEARSLLLDRRAHFLGFVNQSGLPSAYRAADLLVLPSGYDPCPVVVCESMLCGCPVVLSDRVRGRFDLVEHGKTGFIYPCGDVEALACTLRDALGDRDRLRAMARAAAKRMETWSPRDNVAAFIAAAEKAVARRPPRGSGPRAGAARRRMLAGDEALAAAPPARGPATKEPAMRLVIYTRAFAPQVGGVETAVTTLAKGLARTSEADKSRTIAGRVPGGRESASSEEDARIEVTVVTPAPAGEMDDRALAFRVVRQPGFFTLFRLLREADLIHLAGPALAPLGLCALLRKPVVIEHHGYQAICPNGLLFYEPTKTLCPGHFMAGRHRECLRCNAGERWLRSLRLWVLTFPRRWLSRLAASNVAISEHVAQRLALPRSRVIYYGTEERQPAVSSTPAPSSGEICFAYVGRLVSEKGLPLLIEAAGRLRAEGRQFRLKFVGDGPECERLEEGARALGLEGRLAITGMLSGTEYERALADVDVLVMPSIWEETAGLAAMEQMMRGRLVIAADVGGLGEVVGDAGLKFRPGDVDGLCACLRRVLDQPEIVQEYGAKARERAQKLFRSERMIEERRRLYRTIAGRLGGGFSATSGGDGGGLGAGGSARPLATLGGADHGEE